MRKVFLFPAALATVVATLPGAAQATSTTCTTSTVCAEYINTYTSSSPVSGGVAIHGEANGGIGIRGTSVSNVGFYGASGSGSYMVPGVEGESTNSSGMDGAGGFGLAYLATNTAPFVGAVAYGSRGGFVGFTTSAGTSSSGVSGNGFGIGGQDDVGAPSASGDFNSAIIGETKFGTGVLANANGAPSAGLLAKSPIGIYSVADTADGTPTDTAYSYVGESNYIGLDLINTNTNYTLLANTPAFFLEGEPPSNGGGSFYVSTSGNALFSGTVTTSKGVYVRTTGSSGAAMREYGDRMTAPQVEDVGEGRLANGRAFVPIDARLGDTIDRRVAYHVFLTPEGDCKGLYVAQKSPGGFAVRELQGGRSSLLFEYRIVAKPADENGPRLAAMPAETSPRDIDIERGANAKRMARPPSLEEEFKRRLGPQRYAKAIAALRARLAGR